MTPAAPAGTKYSIDLQLKKETQLALWICLSTLCRNHGMRDKSQPRHSAYVGCSSDATPLAEAASERVFRSS